MRTLLVVLLGASVALGYPLVMEHASSKHSDLTSPKQDIAVSLAHKASAHTASAHKASADKASVHKAQSDYASFPYPAPGEPYPTSYYPECNAAEGTTACYVYGSPFLGGDLTSLICPENFAVGDMCGQADNSHGNTVCTFPPAWSNSYQAWLLCNVDAAFTANQVTFWVASAGPITTGIWQQGSTFDEAAASEDLNLFTTTSPYTGCPINYVLTGIAGGNEDGIPNQYSIYFGFICSELDSTQYQAAYSSQPTSTVPTQTMPVSPSPATVTVLADSIAYQVTETITFTDVYPSPISVQTSSLADTISYGGQLDGVVSVCSTGDFRPANPCPVNSAVFFACVSFVTPLYNPLNAQIMADGPSCGCNSADGAGNGYTSAACVSLVQVNSEASLQADWVSLGSGSALEVTVSNNWAQTESDTDSQATTNAFETTLTVSGKVPVIGVTTTLSSKLSTSTTSTISDTITTSNGNDESATVTVDGCESGQLFQFMLTAPSAPAEIANGDPATLMTDQYVCAPPGMTPQCGAPAACCDITISDGCQTCNQNPWLQTFPNGTTNPAYQNFILNNPIYTETDNPTIDQLCYGQPRACINTAANQPGDIFCFDTTTVLTVNTMSLATTTLGVTTTPSHIESYYQDAVPAGNSTPLAIWNCANGLAPAPTITNGARGGSADTSNCGWGAIPNQVNSIPMTCSQWAEDAIASIPTSACWKTTHGSSSV